MTKWNIQAADSPSSSDSARRAWLQFCRNVMKHGSNTLDDTICFFFPSLVTANYVQKTGLAQMDGFFFLSVQRQSSFPLVPPHYKQELSKLTWGQRCTSGFKRTTQAYWESLRHMTAPAENRTVNEHLLVGVGCLTNMEKMANSFCLLVQPALDLEWPAFLYERAWLPHVSEVLAQWM